MPLILGAGLAGLSLAERLVELGDPGSIVLVDRRTAYEHDRTWCFWETDPSVVREAGLVAHRWATWRLVGRDGTAVVRRSEAHPYVQVRADAFYERSLARLDRSGVELRLGTRVTGIDGPASPTTSGPGDDARPGDTEPTYVVRTTAGPLRATHVVDAMGGSGPLNARRPLGAIELRQSFLGLEVEVDRPVFDPAVATLMDFRCGPEPAGGGLHFMYVLPTSPTRALVEHTTLGPGTVPARRRRQAIADYLGEHWGVRHHDVVREERGVLPMSSHDFPARHAPGLSAIGAAAGAVRPSSGYAFVRTRRHVDAVARAVVSGGELPRRVGLQRHAVLDQLFLRALAVDPPAFDRTLLAMARGTTADAFARFMSDASTLRDEATIMGALVRPGFLLGMGASSLLRPIAR